MAKTKDGKKNEKSNVKATGGSKVSEQANAPFPPDETQNEQPENDIKSEEKQPEAPINSENSAVISESQPSSEIPANAPEVTTETEEKQAQAESEGAGQSISETSTSPDAPAKQKALGDDDSYTPFNAPVKEKNISGEVENSTDANNINPPADVTPADAPVSEVENIVPVAPTQDELEERVFEKWWIGRNRPTEVNHFELANDINMNKFSSYEATVGKFKFKRSHAGANWQITVDEKK